MEDVILEVDENGNGSFFLKEGDRKIGEMIVGISGHTLTAFHTEVVPEAEGKGLARQLLGAMTNYARENHLSVIPACPYVLAQFKRKEQEYADIWQK